MCGGGRVVGVGVWTGGKGDGYEKNRHGAAGSGIRRSAPPRNARERPLNAGKYGPCARKPPVHGTDSPANRASSPERRADFPECRANFPQRRAHSPAHAPRSPPSRADPPINPRALAANPRNPPVHRADSPVPPRRFNAPRLSRPPSPLSS